MEPYSYSRDIEADGKAEGLYKDVAFNRASMQDGKHISPFDNARIDVGGDNVKVRLAQGINEKSFKRVLSKATQATTGIDMDAETDDESWEEMLKGGLQGALETQIIVFEVTGVSRACTHQLVRTRKAGFHQQSMRATYYGERPETRMPESVFRNTNARLAFERAMEASHEAYQIAVDEDISYQDARFILPEATTNYILLEYSVREFLNVYAYRACSMFQWEHVTVMRKCREALVGAHPWIEPYVKISCEKTKGNLDHYQPSFRDEDGALHTNDPEALSHHCTFQGWEEVDKQCDFPWARESNRVFVSELYSIKTKKEER